MCRKIYYSVSQIQEIPNLQNLFLVKYSEKALVDVEPFFFYT